MSESLKCNYPFDWADWQLEIRHIYLTSLEYCTYCLGWQIFSAVRVAPKATQLYYYNKGDFIHESFAKTPKLLSTRRDQWLCLSRRLAYCEVDSSWHILDISITLAINDAICSNEVLILRCHLASVPFFTPLKNRPWTTSSTPFSSLNFKNVQVLSYLSTTRGQMYEWIESACSVTSFIMWKHWSGMALCYQPCPHLLSFTIHSLFSPSSFKFNLRTYLLKWERTANTSGLQFEMVSGISYKIMISIRGWRCFWADSSAFWQERSSNHQSWRITDSSFLFPVIFI